MSVRPWLAISLLAVASFGAIGSLYWTTQPSVEPTPIEQSAPPATTSTTATTTPAVPTVPLAAPGSIEAGCLTGETHAPTGALLVVPGTREPTEGDLITRYIIEMEEGLAIDGSCFADEVERVLSDSRSWAGDGSLSMQRVDSGTVDLRITIASPATTDARCAPMQTNGIYSCWDGERAMINVWRWEHATEEFEADLATYRTYVINHEVGHGLGHNHRLCPGVGSVAPVMQQQTIALSGCTANGWPLETERP